jgi:ribose 5-phosphate isomerase B
MVAESSRRLLHCAPHPIPKRRMPERKPVVPPRPTQAGSDSSPADREGLRRIVSEIADRVLGESPKVGASAKPAPVPSARARWVVWEAPRPESAPSSKPPRAVFPPTAPSGGRAGKPVVAVGSDHGALDLKRSLVRYLQDELGHPVLDCGTHSEEPVDYPDIARAVATAVTEGRAWRGVVLDAMGVGSTMAANKIPGALCALCHDDATVRNAREHNDANLLALGSRVVNLGQARGLVRLFLATPHAGGRHARRVAKIRELDWGLRRSREEESISG